jgi:CRP-like cAMP-binding protein
MPAGEFCGEVALFDGGTRSASVCANEATELLVIERAHLLSLMRSQPGFAMPLLAALSARLRALTQEFEDATFLALPQRLAKKLLSLATVHGEPTPEGRRIGLALSQEQLGAMVGTSRESINKQLRAWKEAGVARHEAGFVTVLSVERLGLIARGED